MNLQNLRRNNCFTKFISASILIAFIFTSIIPYSYAQSLPQISFNLPISGTMISTSAGFNPAIIKGVSIVPDNPLQFNFIVNTGDDDLQDQAFKDESTKLIKYFLAAITVPEEEMWVNLSPYEKNRVIPDGLGVTQMGVDMLAQDYILKQLTASMIYPENEFGREFWSRVYEKAQIKFGTTEIPMDTFNKIWIVPDQAAVYEHEGTAFVIERHLKVMLQEDLEGKEWDMLNKGEKSDNSNEKLALTSQVIREVLIPEIEKEVNEGKNFAPLRQIYNSVILATWYKQTLKESLLGQVYMDQNKTLGVDVNDAATKQRIYEQYLETFKKGVYNYIKEDYDPTSQSVVTRKYISGGMMGVSSRNFRIKRGSTDQLSGAERALPLKDQSKDRAVLANLVENLKNDRAVLGVNARPDAAMGDASSEGPAATAVSPVAEFQLISREDVKKRNIWLRTRKGIRLISGFKIQGSGELLIVSFTENQEDPEEEPKSEILQMSNVVTYTYWEFETGARVVYLKRRDPSDPTKVFYTSIKKNNKAALVVDLNINPQGLPPKVKEDLGVDSAAKAEQQSGLMSANDVVMLTAWLKAERGMFKDVTIEGDGKLIRVTFPADKTSGDVEIEDVVGFSYIQNPERNGQGLLIVKQRDDEEGPNAYQYVTMAFESSRFTPLPNAQLDNLPVKIREDLEKDKPFEDILHTDELASIPPEVISGIIEEFSQLRPGNIPTLRQLKRILGLDTTAFIEQILNEQLDGKLNVSETQKQQIAAEIRGDSSRAIAIAWYDQDEERMNISLGAILNEVLSTDVPDDISKELARAFLNVKMNAGSMVPGVEALISEAGGNTQIARDVLAFQKVQIARGRVLRQRAIISGVVGSLQYHDLGYRQSLRSLLEEALMQPDLGDAASIASRDSDQKVSAFIKQYIEAAGNMLRNVPFEPTVELRLVAALLLKNQPQYQNQAKQIAVNVLEGRGQYTQRTSEEILLAAIILKDDLDYTERTKEIARSVFDKEIQPLKLQLLAGIILPGLDVVRKLARDVFNGKFEDSNLDKVEGKLWAAFILIDEIAYRSLAKSLALEVLDSPTPNYSGYYLPKPLAALLLKEITDKVIDTVLLKLPEPYLSQRGKIATEIEAGDYASDITRAIENQDKISMRAALLAIFIRVYKKDLTKIREELADVLLSTGLRERKTSQVAGVGGKSADEAMLEDQLNTLAQELNIGDPVQLLWAFASAVNLDQLQKRISELTGIKVESIKTAMFQAGFIERATTEQGVVERLTRSFSNTSQFISLADFISKVPGTGKRNVSAAEIENILIESVALGNLYSALGATYLTTQVSDEVTDEEFQAAYERRYGSSHIPVRSEFIEDFQRGNISPLIKAIWDIYAAVDLSTSDQAMIIPSASFEAGTLGHEEYQIGMKLITTEEGKWKLEVRIDRKDGTENSVEWSVWNLGLSDYLINFIKNETGKREFSSIDQLSEVVGSAITEYMETYLPPDQAILGEQLNPLAKKLNITDPVQVKATDAASIASTVIEVPQTKIQITLQNGISLEGYDAKGTFVEISELDQKTEIVFISGEELTDGLIDLINERISRSSGYFTAQTTTREIKDGLEGIIQDYLRNKQQDKQAELIEKIKSTAAGVFLQGSEFETSEDVRMMAGLILNTPVTRAKAVEIFEKQLRIAPSNDNEYILLLAALNIKDDFKYKLNIRSIAIDGLAIKKYNIAQIARLILKDYPVFLRNLKSEVIGDFENSTSTIDVKLWSGLFLLDDPEYTDKIRALAQSLYDESLPSDATEITKPLAGLVLVRLADAAMHVNAELEETISEIIDTKKQVALVIPNSEERAGVIRRLIQVQQAVLGHLETDQSLRRALLFIADLKTNFGKSVITDSDATWLDQAAEIIDARIKNLLADAALLGAIEVQVPEHFGRVLARGYDLVPVKIEAKLVKGKGGAGKVNQLLTDSRARYILESGTAAAIGSFFFRGRGKKTPKGLDIKVAGDANSLFLIEEETQRFIDENPEYAIVELASEGARDGSISTPVGRIHHKDVGGELHYLDTAAFRFDASGKGKIKYFAKDLYTETLTRLRNKGVKIIYKVSDSLEKTEGLVDLQALDHPTDSWAMNTFIMDDGVSPFRLPIDDNFRTAGYSYNAPNKANIGALDVPSVAIPKIAEANGIRLWVDDTVPEENRVITPEYKQFLEKFVLVMLGPRNIDLKDADSSDERHMHYLVDMTKFMQMMNEKYGVVLRDEEKGIDGLALSPVSDGDLMPRLRALAGKVDSWDDKYYVVMGRSGSAEAEAARAFAKTVEGAHMLSRRVSTTATAKRVADNTADKYSEEERSVNQILGYQEEDLTKVLNDEDEDIDTFVGMTSVTGATNHLGEKFAEDLQRVNYNSPDKIISTRTVMTDEEGNIYVVEVTYGALTATLSEAATKIMKAHSKAAQVLDEMPEFIPSDMTLREGMAEALMQTSVLEAQVSKIEEALNRIPSADHRTAVKVLLQSMRGQINTARQAGDKSRIDSIVSTIFWQVLQGDDKSVRTQLVDAIMEEGIDAAMSAAVEAFLEANKPFTTQFGFRAGLENQEWQSRFESARRQGRDAMEKEVEAFYTFLNVTFLNDQKNRSKLVDALMQVDGAMKSKDEIENALTKARGRLRNAISEHDRDTIYTRRYWAGQISEARAQVRRLEDQLKSLRGSRTSKRGFFDEAMKAVSFQELNGEIGKLVKRIQTRKPSSTEIKIFYKGREITAVAPNAATSNVGGFIVRIEGDSVGEMSFNLTENDIGIYITPAAADAAMTETDSDIVEDLSILKWTSKHGKTLEQVLSSVVKEYDIRGFDGYGDPKKYPQQFDETLLQWIGRALGTTSFKSDILGRTVQLKPGDTFVIAGDNGPSTSWVLDNFIIGLRETGVNVINLGVTVSDHLYSSVSNLGAQGGLYVTRSHVEIGTNGAKPIIGGITLYADMLSALKDQILSGKYRKAKKPGDLLTADLDQRDAIRSRARKMFIDSLREELGSLKQLLAEKPMKIAYNLSGGSATGYGNDIREIVGDQFIVDIFRSESDPMNENGGLADPSRADVTALSHPKADIMKYSSEHPDVVIFNYDLDADRVSIVWGGKLYLGDEMFYPVIEYQLDPNLNKYASLYKTIYYDSRMKNGVREMIEANGGVAKLHPKGHSKVKITMQKDLEDLAKSEGKTVEEFLAANPGFMMVQPEYSLHMFATNKKGEPFDGAIRFSLLWLEMFSKIKDKYGKPDMTLQDYIDINQKKGNIKRSVALDEQRMPSTDEQKKNVMLRMKQKVLDHFEGRTDFEYLKEWRNNVQGKPYQLIDVEGVFDLTTPEGKVFWGWSNTSPKVAYGSQSKNKKTLAKITGALVALYIHSRNEIAAESGVDLVSIDPLETAGTMKLFNVYEQIPNEASDEEKARINAGMSQRLEAKLLKKYPTVEAALKGLDAAVLSTAGKSVDIADAASAADSTNKADAASNVGGINLNPKLINLQIKRDGNGVPLPINQQPIQNMQIDGFLPVIIQVTPISIPLILGLTPEGEDKPTDISYNLSKADNKRKYELVGAE